MKKSLTAAVVLLVYSGTLLADVPRIQILGVEPMLAENVRASLRIADEPCDFPTWRERGLLRTIPEDVDRGMRALGYYQSSTEFQFSREEACWGLDLDISPGPRTMVRSIEIQLRGEAAEDPAFADLLAAPPIAEGDALRHDRYEAFKRSLGNLAAQRGYFDAVFEVSELQVHRGDNMADIVLLFDSGPRYKLGSLLIDQSAFDEDLVRRFITCREGAPYNTGCLIELQQAYIDSRYFADVRVDPRPEAADDDLLVPIEVRLVERNKWSYLAGIGAATDVGPRLRLGIENHRVNRRGHRYQIDSELAPVRSNLTFNYEIPLADPARERINLSAGFQTEDTNTATSDRYRLGVAHLKQYPSGWIHTRSLRYEREAFRIADTRATTRLLMPGYELSRTRANRPVYPTRGWRLSGEVRGAHEDFGSDLNILQLVGGARLVQGLGDGRLLLRADGGASLLDEFETLPPSLRFFAGGDQSVRGYGYQRLGPTDEQGRIIGGRHLMTGSVEYEHPIRGPWHGAVFLDVGNAYDRLDDVDFKYGFGAGIRWRSPIGPIRVDIARPSDGRDAFRLHLSMGLDL